jgi:iron(III) transport system substrate-binding protein
MNLSQRRRAMKITVLKKIIVSFTLFLMLAATYADAASSPLLQAKKEAESKGYIFFTTHDEIVAMAKKEGKLRVSCGMERANFKPLIDGFKQKYPFFTDVNVEEITSDAVERFILEIKSGGATEWDICHVPSELGKEYMPYLMKHDILGMAKQGVLKIDPRMVHTTERDIVGITSSISVAAYNRKLISEDKVPAKWVDFLKPEFKGKKFILDIRPLLVASLVPAWGLDRTLEFARKLAAQQPVWGRGPARIATGVAAGEYALHLDVNFSTVKRAMSKDPTGNLNYKIIEPVTTMIGHHSAATLKTAAHPNAALLWLEFLVSHEGQDIIDKYEPLKASVFTLGSIVAKEVQGKELSVVGWEHFTRLEEYMAKIFEAYGFPGVNK